MTFCKVLLKTGEHALPFITFQCEQIALSVSLEWLETLPLSTKGVGTYTQAHTGMLFCWVNCTFFSFESISHRMRSRCGLERM